jgi:hypothetical protein
MKFSIEKVGVGTMRTVMWITATGIVYVLNLAIIAAAFRLHRGRSGLGMGLAEFLRASALAATGLTILTPVLWYIQIGLMGITPNAFECSIVAAVMLVPLGAQFVNWSFGLDEWGEGFSVFLLFLAIPVLLILLTRQVSQRVWQSM